MLGTVTVLRRYPVKSMLGEELDAAEVSRSGLARDRRLAVVSRQTGKVASAKYPRLWRDMLTLSAEALDDATARITLPDGKTVSSTDPGVDEVLSGLLGQPVTLAGTPPDGATLDRAVPEAVLRDGIKAQVAATLIEIGAAAPPGTFVDFAPLHLITTATLDRIAELSPYRRVRRWEHEQVLDDMQRSLDRTPEASRLRRQTVEHPFGTLKAWMGSTHFLTKTLERVRTEMSLHVLAYNLKRLTSLLGFGATIAAMKA